LLEGQKVRLRSFELSDLDEIMKHWNKIELRRFLGAVDRGPASHNEEEEWIKNTWKERKEKKAHTFAVETVANNQLIGGTGIFGIDWTSRSAEAGISIYNPEFWGKGFGAEALELLLGFAFRDLNMNRIGLEVFDFNKRAYKCYVKVGFRETGKRRKVKFIQGQYHDGILMDILKDEWVAKRKTA
jgi:RimJ/RimL family protein N-acetyltransferase